jgi:FKBP-type peptidyl-prolyl cis-trans isomerase FklB
MKCVTNKKIVLKIIIKKKQSNMKKVILSMLCLSMISAGVNAQKKKNQTKSEGIQMMTSIDSFSYAIGITVANQLKSQGINQLSLPLMMMAMNDVLANNKTLMTPEQAGMTLQEKLQEFNQKKAEAMKSKGVEFLETCKKKPGVIALPNGLQYEVLTAGDPNGMRPTKEDTVVVHYVGTLIDGKEFDNSIKRGEPIEFPLGGVIKGWTEILQLMTVGSKWRVYIPSELGYGERGAGASIPPFSTLIFEIDLKGIKPAVKK